jgi:hypothetical protein
MQPESYVASGRTPAVDGVRQHGYTRAECPRSRCCCRKRGRARGDSAHLVADASGYSGDRRVELRRFSTRSNLIARVSASLCAPQIALSGQVDRSRGHNAYPVKGGSFCPSTTARAARQYADVVLTQSDLRVRTTRVEEATEAQWVMMNGLGYRECTHHQRRTRTNSR